MQSLISHSADDASYFFVSLLLQSALLAALALLAAAAFRHHAAARYAILFPALLAMLVLPFSGTLFERSGVNLILVPVTGKVREADAEFYSRVATAQPLTGWSDTVDETSNVLNADDPQRGFKAVFRAFQFNLNRLLLSLWLCGATIALLKLLVNLVQLQRITTVGRLITPKEIELVTDSVRPYKADWEAAGAGLIIRVSHKINSPMLCGLRRPVLLLPESFLQGFESRQLGAVLLHELAHLERRDMLFNIVQKVVLALYWFNPLVYLMDRQIDRAREEVCDNHVLNHQHAVEYGELLLKLGLAMQRKTVEPRTGGHLKPPEPELAMGMFDPEWKLEQRIKDLLSDKREKSMQLNNVTTQVIRAGIISCAVGLAALQVGAAELPVNPAGPLSIPQPEPSPQSVQISGDSGEAQVLVSQQYKEEIRTSIRQALREVELELDAAEIQEEIETAMVGIREQLAELGEQSAGDGIVDFAQLSAISRLALESALQSLEEIDVEKLTGEIRNNLRENLDGLNDLDLDLDIDVDFDNREPVSEDISIEGPV